MFDFLMNKILYHQHLYITTTISNIQLFINHLKIEYSQMHKGTPKAAFLSADTKVINMRVWGITKFKVSFI